MLTQIWERMPAPAFPFATGNEGMGGYHHTTFTLTARHHVFGADNHPYIYVGGLVLQNLGDGLSYFDGPFGYTLRFNHFLFPAQMLGKTAADGLLARLFALVSNGFFVRFRCWLSIAWSVLCACKKIQLPVIGFIRPEAFAFDSVKHPL